MSNCVSGSDSKSVLKNAADSVERLKNETLILAAMIYKHPDGPPVVQGNAAWVEHINTHWNLDNLPTDHPRIEENKRDLVHKLNSHKLNSPNLATANYDLRRKFMGKMLNILNHGSQAMGYGNPTKLPIYWPCSVPWTKDGVHNLEGRMHQLIIQSAYEHYGIDIDVGSLNAPKVRVGSNESAVANNVVPPAVLTTDPNTLPAVDVTSSNEITDGGNNESHPDLPYIWTLDGNTDLGFLFADNSINDDLNIDSLYINTDSNEEHQHMNSPYIITDNEQ